MFRITILLLFTFLSMNLSAEIKDVIWIENNPDTNESSDILDVIIPGSGQSINVGDEEDTELNKNPFPDKPEEKNSSPKANSFNLNSYNKLISPEGFTSYGQNEISYKQINKDYNSRIPTMALKDVVDEKCHPYHLNNRLNLITDDKDYITELRNFFKKCDRKLIRGNRNKYSNLIKTVYRKYKVLENENAQRFKLRFENDQTIEGFLALKPGKARPLVIVKCGVFCDGRSSSINNMLVAALYDSGPFHIMMVANHTGPKNIRDNARVNFGGFMAGQELIDIAKWAKKSSSFKDHINEVHVLGISLGGHSALYSAIYNEHLDEKIIDSVMGFCPVVNLKDSVKDITTNGVMGVVVSHVVKDLIRDNFDNIPNLQNYFDDSRKVNRKTLAPLLTQVNTDYIQSIDPNSFMEPYKGLIVEDAEHFAELGDFIAQAKKITTPIFVWASKNDPVVRNKYNSGPLEEAIPYPTANKNIQVLNVKKGSHCAVFESYDKNVTGTILNNFFIRHSKSLQNKKRNLAAINIEPPHLNTSERFVTPRLLTFPNFDKLVFQYKIHRGPVYQKPFYAKDQDFKYYNVEIPFTALPFDVETPTNTVESHILTRWLNRNIIFKKDGQLHTLDKEAPNQFEWTQYNP